MLKLWLVSGKLRIESKVGALGLHRIAGVSERERQVALIGVGKKQINGPFLYRVKPTTGSNTFNWSPKQGQIRSIAKVTCALEPQRFPRFLGKKFS